MGIGNRQRRRMKQQHQRSRTSGERGGRSGDEPGQHRDGGSSRGDRPGKQVGELIELAARAVYEGRADAEDLINELLAGATGVGGRSTVAERLGDYLRIYLAAVLRHGWEPVDVYRVLRRRVGADAAGVTATVLGAAGVVAAPIGSRRRWEEQLAELRGQGRPIDPDRPDWPTGVVGAVSALGLLAHLPTLPSLDSFTGRPEVPVDRATSSVLSKVRGLLAKAESTTFPEEADACMAKAQELVTRHNLEHAVAEARHGGTPNEVEARRCWLDDPYLPAKSLLLGVVAKANRCRAVSSTDLGFVTVVGHPDDVDGTEVLFTSLLVQATRRMAIDPPDAATNLASSRSRARRPAYRRSFLVAYANRIGQRLVEAAAAATSDASASDASLLPVLARRTEQVDGAVSLIFPRLVQSRVTVSDAAGWAAGTAAADLADIAVRQQLPGG